MGPTVEELNKVLNIKRQIKQSIINRGVEITDTTPFADYPSKIDSIPDNYGNGYNAGLDEGYSNGYSDGYGTGYEEGSANGGGDPYYEELYNLRTNNGTNMAGMFARTSGELDLRRLDVSNVTSMKYMFDYSTASVNIDGWDTNNVTDMGYMFSFFSGSVDISKLDTSKVTNANYMLYNANTDNIILTGLSFPKCTKLDDMFSGATGTVLDLSSWDISNITSMSYMFAGGFKKIDLTGWNTSNVTNMSSMFYKSSNPLVELIIPDWDMTNVTSSSSFMKNSYMTKLNLIDLSRSNDATITKIASFLPTRTTTTYGTVLVPYDTSQEAYDALMAKYWAPIGAALSPAPTSVDIVAELDEIMPGKSTKVYIGACEPWNADPNKVELVLVSDSSIATMTEDNEVISTGVLGDIVIEARIIDTQEVVGTKTISVSETDSYPNLVKFRMINKPSSYVALLIINGSAKTISNVVYDSITDIYSYDADAPITSFTFNHVANISKLVKLNTSNMTSTSNMFKDCDSITSLDLSNFDMANITNTDNMFSGCTSLHTLRLDNCSNDTISKIITSSGFPANNNGTIYCKEENAQGLSAPGNWEFSYID